MHKTRSGGRMDMRLRERIVETMSNPLFDGATQKEIAAELGISIRTLQNYLTEHLWAEVKERRLHIVNNVVGLLDKALLKKALKGDVAAAKVLYDRWDKLKKRQKADPPLSLNELNAQIAELRAEIAALEAEENAG
jgi:predicted transcriptional regulator